MIPFGLSEEQFIKRYMRCIDRSTSQLIEKLEDILSLDVPETVTEAEVQIFLDQEGMDSPGAWIYYKGKNTKIDRTDHTIYPGQSIEILNIENIDDFDELYYTDEDFHGVYIIANAVKTWVSECWWKAGGWNYTVPVKVWVHDEFGDGEYIVLSKPK